MGKLSDELLSLLQSDNLFELDLSDYFENDNLEKMIAILKIKNNQNLHSVKINNCSIDSSATIYLENIFSRLKGLHYLELKHCTLLSENLNFLSFCQNLVSISLAGTHLSIQEINQFTSIIKDCKYLNTIDISRIGLTKKCLPMLGKALSKLPVKYLNMQNNHLGSDCGSQLTELIDGLPSLIQLNLQHTYLSISDKRTTTDVIRRLSAILISHPNLQHLNLARNSFDSPSIKLLMESLKQNKKIKFLDLSNNDLTTTSLKLIKEAIEQQHSLQYLEVGIAKPNTLQRELIKAIQEKLNANKKAEITRRNEFILLIFNLASSARKTQESATLASLPLELLLPIFSDMDFSCIGKETEVGLNCIRFLFNHNETIKLGLSQSKYKHQPIIIEKVMSNPYLTQFSLFKTLPLLATEEIDAMEIEDPKYI